LETLLLILGFTLAAIYAMAIGGNDTANSVASPFGGGIASYNKLLLIFTISVFLGAILQGHMVIKTLGKGVVSDLDLYAALSASLAGITWVFTATYLGLPVSTSQSITGGVIGSGIAMIIVLGKSVELNTRVIVDIIVSWALSPILAVFLTTLLYMFLNSLLSRARSMGSSIRWLALLATAWAGYSFAANDVANAVGVYYAFAGKLTRSIGVDERVFLTVYGAFFIVLGGVLFGRRVIETMGLKITRLDPIASLSSLIITASSIWIYTTIPYILIGYGIPVSTTYISVGAIMGAGIGKYRSIKRGLNLKIVALIVLSWALTLPLTICLSICFYYLFTRIFTGV